MTFAFIIRLISAFKILRKHYVADRQLERQKMKNIISLEQTVFRGGCFPISQCLPPSSNEHIFSTIGVHVLTIIQFCGFFLHFHIPNIHPVFYIISYFV